MGRLVLNQWPAPLAGLSAEMRERSTFMLPVTEPATACFSLEQRVRGSSMAGIIPRGATRWTQRGDTVSLLLYASPDASYRLTAVVRGNRLEGLGRGSGFVGTAFSEPGGDVHGVRIGPADVRWCQAPAR